MSATPEKAIVPALEKKPVKFSNLLLGAGLNMFEVTTLGQVSSALFPSKSQIPPNSHFPKPLEVIKTTMAANRGDSFAGAMGRIWGRGGILGCMYPQLSRLPYICYPDAERMCPIQVVYASRSC